MSIKKETGVCNFYDPRDNVTHHMCDAELSNCVVLFSKYGWLLVSRGTRSMFFYEPFTKEKIELPDMPRDFSFNGICFSGLPPNYTIFGVWHVFAEWLAIVHLDISTGIWDWEVCDNDFLFLPSWSNPVFLNETFYCLGQDGSLGIYELREAGYTWKILDKPEPLCFPSAVGRNFLVSIEEELLSVFVGNLGEWVKVFKLRVADSEWVEVKNLGSQMLFVSPTTSLAVVASEEKMKNKFIFPSSATLMAKTCFILWKLVDIRPLRLTTLVEISMI
ncbi:hypothetical protein L1049_018757 [Liquidambar formosana]|uniref:KIB1-4 beta-propeller domain-containing protein n=1 Tax=Liquidambar formosana TaxID=63359 RepID=A0AAP0RAI6_LIQFO